MISSVGRVLMTSSSSTAVVFLVGFAGALLEKQGIMDGSGRKKMAETLTFCLLPALIFTKVSAAIEQAGPNIIHWLVVPLFALFYTIAGIYMVRFMFYLWRIQRRRFRGEATYGTVPTQLSSVAVALYQCEEEDDTASIQAVVQLAVAFTNSGGLPLALVSSLCESSVADLLGGDECLPTTVGYVSFYIAVMNPLLWLLGPRLLGADASAKKQQETGTPTTHHPSPWHFLERMMGALPPPVHGALLGAIIGFIPRARSILLGPVGHPTVFGAAAEILASAAVPLSLLNLGASISSKAGGKPSSNKTEISLWLISGAAMLRLLLIPALSIPIIVLLHRYVPQLIPPNNPALIFVLMIESATPPAMSTMVLIQLYAQHLEGPLGKILVFLYIGSLVTLTAWITIILCILTVLSET